MNRRIAGLAATGLLVATAAHLVFTTHPQYPYEFKRGLDIQGGMHVVLEAQPTKTVPDITPRVMDAATAVVRHRVDGLGVAEPLIQRVGGDRLIVDLPGLKDPDQALKVLGTTAVLSFKAHAADLGKPGGQAWVETGVTGQSVTSAHIEPDGSGWAVGISFDPAGTRTLGEVSTRLVGKPMGIFLDGKVVSAPVIEQPLDTGNVRVHGSFTAQDARDLKVVLDAGALPVPLAVLENRSVGASLGAEAVHASVFAGAIGMAAVMAFMAAWYRASGWVANAALLAYALFVLAIFKLVPVTLTVPGIAGFVLSLGMAVDANILIFERAREELAGGKKLYAAIEAGFSRAFPAIFDANVTTLMSCSVLFYFGTGLVKGFALTLAIGVVASMFTAITLSRSLLHVALERRTFAKPFGGAPTPPKPTR